MQDRISNDTDISVIPKIHSLSSPTIKEVIKSLDGKVLFGKDMLNNPIDNFSVGAMQLRNYLTYLNILNCFIFIFFHVAPYIYLVLLLILKKNYYTQ